MQIEVTIPRPFRTLVTLGVIAGVIVWLRGDPRLSSSAKEKMLLGDVSHSEELHGEGGQAASPQRVAELTSQIQHARAVQALLGRKEELLRYQVEVLREERDKLGSNVTPDIEQEFRESVEQLTELIKDQKKSEDFLRSAFEEIWEAEGRASQLAKEYEGTFADSIALQWPVEPDLGISAFFLDSAYKKRFGFEHYALDIPTSKGTPVLAAADGVVKDVVDNGRGFNYVTILHFGGFVTLYGHLFAFHVQPGQRVFTGQIIGDSGGRPGDLGSGFSTGEHLHFGVRIKGGSTDPLQFLPKRASVRN